MQCKDGTIKCEKKKRRKCNFNPYILDQFSFWSQNPEQGSHYWIIQRVPFIFLRHKVRKGIDGYESRNIRSKYLKRSKGQTINQDDDNKNNIVAMTLALQLRKVSKISLGHANEYP